MSDGGGGKAVHVFFIYDPPPGGVCSRNAPGPVNDRSGLRRWMCSLLPRADAPVCASPARAPGQVLPTCSRRPPGRADGGPVCECHNCVIIVSYVCHMCVIIVS